MSQNGSINIAIPNTGFKRSMFFNRFAIERADGFVQIYFGFVNSGNVTVDSYATAISELEVYTIQKSIMDYLGRQGTMPDAPPAWQPVNVSRIELSNHICMAHHGTIAETILYQYSHWAALQDAKKRQLEKSTAVSEKSSLEKDSSKKVNLAETSLIAEPMAILRSSLGVQQHLIRLLFTEKEAELQPK